MLRGAVFVAGVASASAAQDWFTAPSCNGETGSDDAANFPGDHAVPAYRADATTCTTLGLCSDGQINVMAGGGDPPCVAPLTHTPYTVDNIGWLDPAAVGANHDKSTPPGWTGASRFADPADPKAASCFALEGAPKQPTYKLPMCKMYNELACCAPIHDAETQWAYETLVNVADRCLQYVNEEHFALREFFCIACDPDQHKYISHSDPDDDDYWGEIRICQSFADRVWKGGEDYDRCGFMIFTSPPELNGGPPSKSEIVPYGDVAPDTADDPVLPSKFWVEEDWRGHPVEQFFNQIKPGMLDNFDFRVIDDTDEATKAEVQKHCFHGSGGAALTLPRVVVVVCAALCSLFL